MNENSSGLTHHAGYFSPILPMKTLRGLLTTLVILGLGVVAAKAGPAYEPLVGFQDGPKTPSHSVVSSEASAPPAGPRSEVTL